MATNIFVNLPVKDLQRSIDFFTALGYTFNLQFTDQNATCMIISENIYCMLLTEPFFSRFMKKEVIDAHKSVECTVCLSMESKEAVNAWADKALSLGATENEVPDMNQGDTMFGRSINDLDGHIWEIMWMDPNVIQKN